MWNVYVFVALAIGALIIYFTCLLHKRRKGYLKKIYGDYALITGSSSGIGVEFAEQLAAEGFNLIITARRKDKLKEVAERITTKYGITVVVLDIDLSSKDGPYMLGKATQDFDIGVLVNNAGAALFGPFDTLQPDTLEQLIQLNAISVAVLSSIFCERMNSNRGKNNRRSAIITVSSLAALTPNPFLAVYAATKSFVSSLSLGLATEFNDRKFPVDFLVCEPGATKTGFQHAANMQNLKANKKLIWSTGEFVVDKTLDALAARRHFIIPNFIDYLSTFLIAILPRVTVANMVSNIFKDDIKS